MVTIVLASIVALFGLLQKGGIQNLLTLFGNKRLWISVLPFIVLLPSLFYSEDMKFGWRVMETKISLVAFPLVVGVIRPRKEDVVLFVKGLVAIVCMAGIAGFVRQAGVYYSLPRDTGWFYNDNLVTLFGKQAVYFAMYINLAFVGLIWLFTEKRVKGILWYALIAILLCFQFLLACRMAMILNLGLVIALIVLVVFRMWGKRGLGVSIVFLVSVISLAILVKPKAFNRFRSLTTTEFEFDNDKPIAHFNGELDPENWNGMNTRLAIWSCAGELISTSPLLGTGVGDVGKDLMNSYKAKNFHLAIGRSYNSHNQYLDYMLGGGICAFLGLLIFLMYPLFIGIRGKDILLLGLSIVLMFSSLTENILSREMGCLMIGLIYSVFLWNVRSDISLENSEE